MGGNEDTGRCDIPVTCHVGGHVMLLRMAARACVPVADPPPPLKVIGDTTWRHFDVGLYVYIVNSSIRETSQ